MSWSRDYVRVLNRLLYACTFLFPPIHLDFHCIQIASLMNVLLPSGAQGKWMKRKGSASTRGVVSCVAEASETFFFSREVRNLLYDLPSRESRVFSISCFFLLYYFISLTLNANVFRTIHIPSHARMQPDCREWLSRPNSLDWPLNVNVIYFVGYVRFLFFFSCDFSYRHHLQQLIGYNNKIAVGNCTWRIRSPQHIPTHRTHTNCNITIV